MRKGPHKTILVAFTHSRLTAIKHALLRLLELGEVPYLDRTTIEGAIRVLRIRLAKEGDK